MDGIPPVSDCGRMNVLLVIIGRGCRRIDLRMVHRPLVVSKPQRRNAARRSRSTMIWVTNEQQQKGGARESRA